jgi:sterol desaturase/sphingolipid hydroxylase (fatty acid hydroxylase superfamily)
MPLYLKFYFWLVLVSVVVFAIERIFSPPPRQEVFRKGFGQDLFWLLLNTQYLGWMLAVLSVYTLTWLNDAFLHFGLPNPESLRLIATWPLSLQFVVFLLLKDFLEWNVHRTLHRVPRLWEFHKLHHSIERLDWLTTFRAHWGEVIIYKLVVYLPLVILGVNETIIFSLLVFGLLVQVLIHANLTWDWGPLNYVLVSPRLHAWHHAVEMHGKHGQNFAITLTIWDWIFRTAYWPRDRSRPAALGFEGSKDYPPGIWGRLWAPFTRRTRKDKTSPLDG